MVVLQQLLLRLVQSIPPRSGPAVFILLPLLLIVVTLALDGSHFDLQEQVTVTATPSSSSGDYSSSSASSSTSSETPLPVCSFPWYMTCQSLQFTPSIQLSLLIISSLRTNKPPIPHQRRVHPSSPSSQRLAKFARSPLHRQRLQTHKTD